LIGNCVATVVIAAWEKDLDLEHAKAVLASGDIEEAETATATAWRVSAPVRRFCCCLLLSAANLQQTRIGTPGCPPAPSTSPFSRAPEALSLVQATTGRRPKA
jgi:hypothetical protein